MAMSRTIRRVLIALGGVIGLVVILVGVAYGVLQTSWAHDRIAAAIERALSSDSMQVKVGAVEGALPQSVTLHNVVASDDVGVFARIGTLKLAWHPWRLLFKSVDIENVTVTDATLDRLPHTAPSSEPQAPSQPISLPSFGITVSSISLDMALGPELTDGMPERLKANGSARYGMGDGIHLNLDASQGGTAGSRLTARIHANPEDETLELDLHAHEAKGGLASRLIGVEDDGPFDIDVTGDGTLADWNGTAKASLGPNGRLEAKIRAFGEATHNVRIKGTAMTPAPLTGRLEPVAAPPYDFDINFAVASGGKLTFTGTSVKTAGASLVANGTVDLSDGSVDMAVGLEPADASVADALTAPVKVPDLALNAHLRGYLPTTLRRDFLDGAEREPATDSPPGSRA